MTLRQFIDTAYALMVDDLRRLGASLDDAVNGIDRMFVAATAEAAAADKAAEEAAGWARTEAVFAGLSHGPAVLPPVSRKKRPRPDPSGAVA